MKEITDAYFTICKSSKFISELRKIRKEFQGRPTPISYLERLSSSLGNVQIYAKREDLNHTGAHKLNHCIGAGRVNYVTDKAMAILRRRKRVKRNKTKNSKNETTPKGEELL